MLIAPWAIQFLMRLTSRGVVSVFTRIEPSLPMSQENLGIATLFKTAW